MMKTKDAPGIAELVDSMLLPNIRTILVMKLQQAVNYVGEVIDTSALVERATRELLHNAPWHRQDDEHDGRYAYLMVKFPYETDLSCRATRDAAIDAALGITPTLTKAPAND